MARTRIGTVGYLNARPLTIDVDEGRYELVPDHPSVIARMLRDGEVDAALVPVGAILDGTGDYRIVPGQAIGADGPVTSVLIAAETPMEQWTEVLLDGASRTSVILAQVLLAGPLKERVRADLKITPVPATTGVDRARGTVATVVIGDAAMQLPERLAVRVDLADVWKQWTGLPFVFAVWAGRPDLSPEVRADLREAARKGVARIPEVWDGAERDYLTNNIRYALDERAMMGLRRFAALAKRGGWLAEDDVQVYGPPSRSFVRRTVDVDTLLSKGATGERLTWDEAVQLDKQASIADLGAAADLRRQMLHPGDEVTYIISRNINYTNVCVTACKFCAFYRPKRHKEAYVLTREQMGQKIQETLDVGGIEILLQGGLHPELGIEWYEDLFRWVKREYPRIALHALSPEEIWHIVNVSKLPIETVIERLIAAGLDSIPGGGAEVLDDEIRKKIAPLKASTQEWLDCMEIAHKQGLKSSATMMFGMNETTEHRVNHLVRLRDLQDRTGGFTAFICWTFVPDNTYVKPGGNTGADYLRTNALSRLVLDNVRNLQASWVTQGPGIAQASLHMGCNDYGSVMLEENVVSAAGNTWALDLANLEHNIRKAGFIPVRRNARYDHVGGALTPADGRAVVEAVGAAK